MEEKFGLAVGNSGLQLPPESFRRLCRFGFRAFAHRYKLSPVVRDHYAPNCKVGLDVNSARFFELLISRLCGKS